jgi:glycosyltransferase involved in cell wall biosynthesis
LKWLLQALSQTDEHIILDVAGDGHYLAKMKSVANKLGLSSRVNFHGWIDEEAVSELIHASRAVVFPSVWHEPAGLVTLEAAAHSRPVIASNVGGIPEYLDSRFGFLVEPHDIETLVSRIHHLASDVESATEMGEKGRSVMQSKYSMDAYLDKLMDIYREVLYR